MPKERVLPAAYFNITYYYLVMKFPEGDYLFSSRHWAVIDDGRLLAATALHVTIHSVVAHVQLPSRKPDKIKNRYIALTT